MATRPGLRRSQASGDTTIYQMKIVFRCSNSLAGKAEASRCNSVALWRGVLMRHGDWTFPADGGRGVHSRSCLGDTVAPETMASRRRRMGTEAAPRCGQTAGCVGGSWLLWLVLLAARPVIERGAQVGYCNLFPVLTQGRYLRGRRGRPRKPALPSDTSKGARR